MTEAIRLYEILRPRFGKKEAGDSKYALQRALRRAKYVNILYIIVNTLLIAIETPHLHLLDHRRQHCLYHIPECASITSGTWI